MDDPTPRSKKGRATECVFGALVPKRGPLLFSGSNVPVNPSSSSVLLVLNFVTPRGEFRLLGRAGLQPGRNETLWKRLLVAQALLPVRVLLLLSSKHSQEWLCYSTFSAASEAAEVSLGCGAATL